MQQIGGHTERLRGYNLDCGESGTTVYAGSTILAAEARLHQFETIAGCLKALGLEVQKFPAGFMQAVSRI